MRQIYQFTRVTVHMFWTIMALYMLYTISWENACLVHMGYPKPYMVYRPGSKAYEDQMRSWPNPDFLLYSLGDLYDIYDFDRFFHFRHSFGPEDEDEEFHWFNFQIYLQILCIFTIFFESL